MRSFRSRVVVGEGTLSSTVSLDVSKAILYPDAPRTTQPPPASRVTRMSSTAQRFRIKSAGET